MSNVSAVPTDGDRLAKVIARSGLCSRRDAEGWIKDGRVTVNGKRPLYMPPEEYFTRVGSADLVCATPSGELVSINDPKCPESVRKAIRATYVAPTASGSSGPGVGLTKSETEL